MIINYDINIFCSIVDHIDMKDKNRLVIRLLGVSRYYEAIDL